MSIYSKEEFIGPSGDMVGTPVVAPQVAAPAAQNTECKDYLQSAVIITMIEGYIAFRAKNHSLTSITDALDFASSFTKELIDNGEITATQLEVIKNWVKAHAFMFTDGQGCCKNKLLHKVLRNCGYTCVAGNASDESLTKYLQACDQLHRAEREALDNIGPCIKTAIQNFINRYGRSMDESYLKTWSLL